MSLIVQKYGGSSLATPELICSVAKRVLKTCEKGHDVIVVLSAMGKTTDQLLDMAYEINGEPPSRELDMLMSTGEQISISMMAIAINALGHPAISFTGPQVGIITDNVHRKAKIQRINPERIRMALKEGRIVMVAGFQGATLDNEITTLGRGGSDTTAVAIAAAMKAERCEIYTDVDGVYSTDPRIVPKARLLKQITYDEMLEMASLGARVLHSRSVELAKNFNVPIYVCSSFHDRPGTLVTKETEEMEDIVVSGVAYNRNESKISLIAVPDRPGVAAEVFGTLGDNHIVVDMIIQNVAVTGTNDITFTVQKEDLTEALRIAEDLAKKLGAKEVAHDESIAKVSVVGVGMKSHTGVAATMFRALAQKKINIEMISTSEIKISCIIREKDLDRAIQAIHDEFALENVG